MKQLLKKFSDHLLSQQQIKNIKGGTTYCMCSGQLIGVPTQSPQPPCSVSCGSPGGGGGGPKPCPYDPKKWC